MSMISDGRQTRVATEDIGNNVVNVGVKMEEVGDKVEDIGNKVEDMEDKVRCIDEKVQVVIDGARRLSDQLSTPFNIYTFRRKASKSRGSRYR